MSKKVVVVAGGNSRERAISLKTGNECAKALKKIGYKVLIIDPKKKPLLDIEKRKTKLIFNALHGKDGEDGLAQSIFEYLKIPYTHSGVISSMKAMDKEISKKIFLKYKVLTPPFIIVDKKEKEIEKKNLKLSLIINKINFPVVIKPVSEGSSIGVKICKDFKSLSSSIKHILKDYGRIMLEEFIPGQEIQVAVMRNKAIGAIELRPKRKFYDYKAKYLKSSKTEHIMPAKISNKKYLEVLKIAEKVHKYFKCRGVTRSDFRFNNNKFYLLEINTQPGMTKLSLVPEIAKYKNISFIKLIKDLVLDAGLKK